MDVSWWVWPFLVTCVLAQTLPYNPKFDFEKKFRNQRVPLNAEMTFHVAWEVTADHITFTVSAQTTGYVGFGISTNGAMKGSDIVIGWVKDGKAFLEDRHATGETEPVRDDVDDYTLLGGSENSTHTSLKFRRKLDTCDDHDIFIEEGTYRLLWAMHPEDPAEGGRIQYHGAERGARSVTLLDHQTEKPHIPDDAFKVGAYANAIRIPTAETTYWCSFHRFPKLNRTHHIVKFNMKIQPGNEPIIHHLNVLACYGDPIPKHLDGFDDICYQDNMPDEIRQCNFVIVFWVIGMEDYYWPPDAGFAIGGPGDPVAYMVEMHYDNVHGHTHLVDSTGFEFTITPTLRKYHADQLLVGRRYNAAVFLVPPHYDFFRHTAVCQAECTQKALAEHPEGINVFANLFHMHLLGRKIRLRHFCQGKELELIHKENNYDFDYQNIRHFKKPINIRAGDMLVLECDYESKDQTKTVVGGLSTRDEMCQAFVQYYPRVDWIMCTSWPNIPDTMDVTDVTKMDYSPTFPYYTVSEPQTKKGMTWLQALKRVDWTQKSNRDKYYKAFLGARNDLQCLRKGQTIQGEGTVYPKTNIPEYKEPTRTCKTKKSLAPHVIPEVLLVATALLISSITKI